MHLSKSNHVFMLWMPTLKVQLQLLPRTISVTKYFVLLIYSLSGTTRFSLKLIIIFLKMSKFNKAKEAGTAGNLDLFWGFVTESSKTWRFVFASMRQHGFIILPASAKQQIKSDRRNRFSPDGVVRKGLCGFCTNIQISTQTHPAV